MTWPSVTRAIRDRPGCRRSTRYAVRGLRRYYWGNCGSRTQRTLLDWRSGIVCPAGRCHRAALRVPGAGPYIKIGTLLEVWAHHEFSCQFRIEPEKFSLWPLLHGQMRRFRCSWRRFAFGADESAGIRFRRNRVLARNGPGAGALPRRSGTWFASSTGGIAVSIKGWHARLRRVERT